MKGQARKLSLHQETLRKLTSETDIKAAVPFSVFITFCIVCPRTVTNCFPCER